MLLAELLRFERIAIQCHDPDADALASGSLRDSKGTWLIRAIRRDSLL